MSMPSLSSVLKMFDEKVLCEFLVNLSFTDIPPIPWETEDAYANLESAITQLNNSNLPLYRRILSKLDDIWTVAEKTSDYDYYIKIIRNDKSLSAPFYERFGSWPIKLHTLSMWLNTTAPNVFDNLLRRKLANSKNACGGTRYFLPTSFSGELSYDNDALASKVKMYFGLKRHIQHQVNVDNNVIGDFVRFVVAMNPMPKEEVAFEKDATEPFEVNDNGPGAAKRGNDSMTKVAVKRPDFIYITYYKKTPRKASSHFTVKAESLTKEDRAQVAKLFAETILSSNVVDKSDIKHDLGVFKRKPKDFRFAEAEEDWCDTRYHGIYMRLTPARPDSKGNNRQEIYHIEVNGDVYDCMDKKVAEIPDGLKTIVSLMLEITVISGERPNKNQMLFNGDVEEKRPKKSYLVTVPASGEWTVKPKPPFVDEEKLVRILEAMDIFNNRGEQVLR